MSLSLRLSGGFTPRRHLRPSSGREHKLYNLFCPAMMITWWMKLWGNPPPGHDILLFSMSGTWSCICPQTRLDIKAFDYPVTQTGLDIPRPLITQSHRQGWTYQGLWLPSHTDTAGHTKAFDYPVIQTRLDIPRPLITQSHRHGWTYQGLWLPSHTDTAGHTKTFDYPVTQTRLDIPRPLITQSHRHGWTYQDLWLPSHGRGWVAKVLRHEPYSKRRPLVHSRVP